MPELSGMIQEFLEGSIKTKGGKPVVNALNVTENGTYTPESGVDGFNPVKVEVPQLILEDKYINANGQYGPSEGYDGFRSVNVDVPIPSIVPLTITENGVYESTGGSGFNPITVNVPVIHKMMNNFNQRTGSAMSIVYNLSGINILWNRGDDIPCALSSIQDIKGASKLDVSFTTGTSYYSTHGAHALREIYVGLTSTYIPPTTYPTSISTWIDYHHVHDDNTPYSFSFDLTEITEQNIFIYISANGWNINDMQISLS